MYRIIEARTGVCPLCVSSKGPEKDKPLFVVEGPGYSGEVCPPHLHVLVQKNGNEKPKDATLFKE